MCLARSLTRRSSAHCEDSREPVPIRNTSDTRERAVPALRRIIPQDPNIPYDMVEIVSKVVDDNNFYQIMPDYAKNLVVGFGECHDLLLLETASTALNAV